MRVAAKKKRYIPYIRFGNWSDGNMTILHFPGSSYPWQALWYGGIPHGQHKVEDLTIQGIRDQLATHGVYIQLGRRNGRE